MEVAPADRGHPVVDDFVASTSPPPDQQATLRQAIDATFAQVERELRRNHVASAMGLALGVSVLLVHGRELSDAESTELILGLDDVIAASPQWQAMTARQKQTINDSLILTSALIIQFAALGQQDEGMRQLSVGMARDLLARLTGSPTGD